MALPSGRHIHANGQDQSLSSKRLSTAVEATSFCDQAGIPILRALVLRDNDRILGSSGPSRIRSTESRHGQEKKSYLRERGSKVHTKLFL